MTDAAYWDLRLLGGFYLAGGGHQHSLTARKAMALLAYLGMQSHHSANREVVAALLWENADRSQARVSLRQALNALRKVEAARPSLIETEGDLIRLSPHVRLDVADFTRLAGGDFADRLEACDIFPSELLAAFQLRDAPAFHEWLAIERMRLGNRLVELLSSIIDEALTGDAGLHVGAVAALRMVRADPYNEVAHRALMQIYARQGRAALAIQQYRSLSQLLRTELQVAPEALTTELHQQLLEQRRRLGAAVPTGGAASLAPTVTSLDNGYPAPPPHLGATWHRSGRLGLFDGLLRRASA